MARIEFRLKHGLPFGKDEKAVMQYDVTLRELGVSDLIAADEESEKVVSTPDGYVMVRSPTLYGINVLRRQILRIGSIEGPLSFSDIGKLNPEDLGLMNRKSNELDTATLKEVTERGRPDAASETS